MNLSIYCPHCNTLLEVDPGWAGHHIDCPICQKAFMVASPPIHRSPPLPVPSSPHKTSNRTGRTSLLVALFCAVALAYVAALVSGDGGDGGLPQLRTLVDQLGVVSYGHTPRSEGGTGDILTSWYVTVKNNASQRAANFYVAFDWLDRNGEQVAFTNELTNLAAGEQLTITGNKYIERRLYSEIAQVGITFRVNGEQRYYVFPARTSQPDSSFAENNLLPVIFGSSVEEATEAAKKFMLGTWTYTGLGWNILGHSVWEKWEVFEDGTMNEYSPRATAENWGSPHRKKWRILTGKYIDSGKRFYAFHIEGQAVKSLIQEDGSVYYRMPDGDLLMERGDKFPFSK